jgi:hypothetical protein
MIKFLALLFSTFVLALRFYVIYKLMQWLVINYNNNNPSFSSIYWFLGVMFLDIYIVSLEKSNSADIYFEKEDEKNSIK